MTGEGYRQSALIARDHGGPFVEYPRNESSFLRVIGMHRDAAYEIPTTRSVPQDMLDAAKETWDDALKLGRKHGYRNAQISVLAPTGTIAFMMDCDTTGIEPDIALIKYKKLVGEGFLKIVNQTVPGALRKLGYSPDQVEAIVAYVNEHETIEGAPELKPEHLPVFDCAFKPVNGERSIHYMGHVRMMAAVQPFISGAISKTVNMPEAATAEEIEQVYLEGWKLGLKAIAIYRDGSKRSQPLSTGKKKDSGTAAAAAAAEGPPPRRAVAASAAGPAPISTSSLPSQAPAASASVQGSGGEPKPYRRRLPAERTRSPTSSTSTATRATSPSASIPTASPARSSSRWPRKAPRSAASWTRWPPRSALRSSTACRCATSSTSSPTSGSSRRASRTTSRSRSPSPPWTTSSAGSARGSCRRTSGQVSA